MYIHKDIYIWERFYPSFWINIYKNLVKTAGNWESSGSEIEDGRKWRGNDIKVPEVKQCTDWTVIYI